MKQFLNSFEEITTAISHKRLCLVFIFILRNKSARYVQITPLISLNTHVSLMIRLCFGTYFCVQRLFLKAEMNRSERFRTGEVVSC